MRAAFSEGCGSVTFHREASDPKFHGSRHAKGEHALFRFIGKWLNAHGFDVIKKRAQKDGHMIGDQYQPYLRCSKPRVRRALCHGLVGVLCPAWGERGLEPRAGQPAPGDRLLREGAGHRGHDRRHPPAVSRRADSWWRAAPARPAPNNRISEEPDMNDETETIRRLQLAEINAQPGSREALEAKHGQVWDSQQLRDAFVVEGFLAPFVVVKRKAGGQRGSLMFQHEPRLYFSFEPYRP